MIRFSRSFPLVAMLVSAAVLAGCTKGRLADPIATGSTSPAGAPSAADKGNSGSYLKTRALAQAWNANPGDAKIGIEYADALHKIGQRATEFEVLKTISASHPSDAALQTTVGKKLLSANRSGEAAAVLERAAAVTQSDWTVYSALGMAYDQQGRYDLARSAYQKALQLKPDALIVENNLGLSYALQGKLPDAEKTLRAAVAQPGSATQPRIRQNLALVIGLQGRFDEAKQVAAADLPPDKVEANLAYLRQMLSKPNTWDQLAKQNQAN